MISHEQTLRRAVTTSAVHGAGSLLYSGGRSLADCLALRMHDRRSERQAAKSTSTAASSVRSTSVTARRAGEWHAACPRPCLPGLQARQAPTRTPICVRDSGELPHSVSRVDTRAPRRGCGQLLGDHLAA
eukprot:scaffold1293_cov375-Prasinococcus_capsulatus_cf.AAC.17